MFERSSTARLRIVARRTAERFAGESRPRQARRRLTVPTRKPERRKTPGWSPRAAAERRPLRRLRCHRL